MAASIDPQTPAPHELGRFEIIATLKSGHGVETLRARDRQGGGDVVVRTSPAELISTGAWMRLEHATVALAQGRRGPRALASGRANGLVYVARPFFEGEPLSIRLARGPLSLRNTLEVARGLLAELRAAHAQGVLHRDLKPANVIVGIAPSISASEVALVDYGLARSERLEGWTAEESAALARYFSPEQAGLVEYAVDERSDLYALGILLYECLTGRPPFAAESLGEMLRLHLSTAPPPLSLHAQVPRALDALISRLLEKDPRDRYQSAAGALADAEQIAAQLEAGVAEPEVLIGLSDARTTLLEPAFVGRGKELVVLEREIERAAREVGGLAIVEAESGGGKTRFLDELARRSVRSFAWVLRGQGLDQGAQRPFQMLAGVVSEILSRARAEPAFADRLRERVGEQAEALRAAVPELAALFESAEKKEAHAQLGDEAHGETRSLEALAVLLAALGEGSSDPRAAPRPAVLLLDDCQWADEPTLKLLTLLARRGVPKHLFIVIAFRSEEVFAPHPLRGLHPAVHLELLKFGESELRDLAQSMAGALPDEALRAVVDLAEGSPFMASAVVRGLVESGALVAEPGGWRIEPLAIADLRAPQNATGFLARRLELLPPRSLELLTVGAVMGKRFELQAVSALCGLAPATLLPAIAAARQRHIVWQHGDTECAFVHDKLRESLLNRLSREERASLHRKAALYLEAQPGDQAFEVAFHFDAAGDFSRALPFALASAKSSRARFALDLAERQYRIAARGAIDSPAELRLSIAEGLGDVLLLRGSYQDAEEQLTLAASLASTDLLRAKLQGKLGELAFKRGDMHTAALRLEGALERLGAIVPKNRATFLVFALWEIAVQTVHTLLPRWTLARRSLDGSEREFTAIRLYDRLAYVYWFQRGQVPCLWAHLREMNLAERYPPTAELAQAYSTHAPVMSMIPLFDRGLRYGEKSLEIRRARGDVWGQGQSLHFIGVILYSAARIRECLERCREAVRLLQRTGDRWEVNTASWHIAFCHYRLGEFREAAACARRVWEAGLEIGDGQASGIALGVWAKATGGRIPRAALEAELSRPSEDVHTAAEILTAQATQFLLEGKPHEAVDSLSRAQEKIDLKGLRQEYVAAVLPWLLIALLREAESQPLWATERRRELLKRASGVARRALKIARAYRNNLPQTLRACAELAALSGFPRRARRLLEESLEVAQLLEAHGEEAAARLTLAQLGIAEGKPGAAEEETRAKTSLVAIGVLDDAEPAPTLSLTDRFAELLEVGRQIASALSPSVVESAVERAARTLLRSQSFRFLQLQPGGGPLGIDNGALLSLSPAEASLAEDALRARGPVMRESAGDELPGTPRCALCVPLLVRGLPRAVFIITHGKVSQALGEEELRLASFIAALAGAALENGDGIGQLQRVERDLALAEKMAALGTLAAGVAHEINNPLSYVMNNLEFVPAELRALMKQGTLASSPGLDEVEQALLEAREGAVRVSEIVRDLRLYSSPEETKPQAIDVVRVLEAMLTLSKAELRHKAKLIRSHQPTPLVVAAETRLGQVFLNLLINAAQAISEEPGKKNEVRVSTRTGEDGFAIIEIADTGSGIPPELRARIFDPFFTTKPVGVGTGLGLSICQGIVRGLGGELSVESEVGKGSTFRVRLPPAPPSLVPMVRLPEPARSERKLRILVIDDEPAIGVALSRMLANHKVAAETRARPALARLLAGETFDVLLCDLMMPEMTGMELFVALAAEKPEMAARIVFITGGAVTERARDFLSRTRNRVFEKPLDGAVLRAFLASL